jgi:CDP-glucose 4,6-dehydratase
MSERPLSELPISELPIPELAVFAGRSVLVTGHTGFKGSWLSLWLQHLGAHVTGLALDPPSTPSHFDATCLAELIDDRRGDIRSLELVRDTVQSVQPDFVFHLAAQPLVRRSYADPVETYQTNVMGTLHVLEALRTLNSPCVAVLITSDKCYDNVEWVWGYRETDRLGGADPYSASKGAAELVIRSHVASYFPSDGPVRIGVGRAGNVVGGGDWAADRIVPDCVRSWVAGDVVELRNPGATRPWQHVLEPLGGYLRLAGRLHADPALHGEPFNFGPPSDQVRTVRELVEAVAARWPDVRPGVEVTDSTGPHEAGLLQLSCDKARHHLGWSAVLAFDDVARLTAEWYGEYHRCPDDPRSVRAITLRQIAEYEAVLERGRR